MAYKIIFVDGSSLLITDREFKALSIDDNQRFATFMRKDELIKINNDNIKFIKSVDFARYRLCALREEEE